MKLCNKVCFMVSRKYWEKTPAICHTFFESSFQSKKGLQRIFSFKSWEEKSQFPFKGTAPFCTPSCVRVCMLLVNLQMLFNLNVSANNFLDFEIFFIFSIVLYFENLRINITWLFDLLSLNGADYLLCYENF